MMLEVCVWDLGSIVSFGLEHSLKRHSQRQTHGL